jgi:hypothetical protein
VTDRAGNIGRFRAHFVAGSKADTIPPRLVKVEPAPGATGRRWGTAMRVRFSEAMDTALAPRWLVVPRAHESLLAPGWDPDWRGFRLTARESLPPGRPVYVLIQPGVQDLEGNPCSAWAYTYFSPDTGLFGRSVAGRVKWEAGPFGTGVVFFDAESSPGMALVARDGTFSTRVAGTNHEVIAVADTNGDGLADLSTSRLAIAAPSETVLFELRPDSLSLPLGAYRR